MEGYTEPELEAEGVDGKGTQETETTFWGKMSKVESIDIILPSSRVKVQLDVGVKGPGRKAFSGEME